MKKLFDSGELGRAESTEKSHTTTEDDLVLPRSIFLSLQKIHEGVEYFEPNRSRLEFLPATKNHQGGLGDSEDESDAKIFSAPDSETGQQSAPHIQLELMPRQLQQGNDDRVLVETNFDRDNVCHMAIKVFCNSSTTAMCKCTIITPLDDSSTCYATNKQAFGKNDRPRTKSQHSAISLNRALNGTAPCIPSLWTLKRPSIAWIETHCGSYWPTIASRIIKLIRMAFEPSKCQVVHNGSLTEPFIHHHNQSSKRVLAITWTF